MHGSGMKGPSDDDHETILTLVLGLVGGGS